MIFRATLRWLPLAICFGGWLYHVFYVNSQYFAYKTSTRVESQLQDIVQYPIIIFCCVLSEIINLNNLTTSNISSTYLQRLSIQQLLDLTPSENQIINSCMLRNVSGNSFEFKEYKQAECYNFFGVKKALTGELICYQIFTIESLNYSIYGIANAISHNLHVLSIHLAAPFAKSRNLFLSAEYLQKSVNNLEARKKFPIYSRMFGEVLARHEDDTWLVIRPFVEDYKLLPAPYDTNCTSRYYGRRPCVVEKTIQRMNLYPFSEPTNESFSNMKILSSSELQQSSYAQMWKEIQDECKNQNGQIYCAWSLTSNLVYPYTYYTETNLTLTVSVPGMYPKKIVALPVISLIEYLSSLTTCISIWFGLSALSLNPFNWINWNIRMYGSVKYGRVAFYIICLTGFLYQIVSISDQYFKFQTSSKIEVSVSDQIKYPTLGICFNYIDILNRSNAEKYGIYKSYQEAWLDWRKEVSMLTVTQIFSLTPEGSSLVSNCSLRQELHYHLKLRDARKCMQFFSIYKALKGYTVCYNFIPPETQTFPWTRVATSSKGKGHVYSLILRLKRPFGSMTVYVTSRQSLQPFPVITRNFAQIVNLRYSNVLMVSSSRNTFASLPAPYDTNCLVGVGQYACLGSCLSQQLRTHLSRMPSSFYINHLANFKIISNADIVNETVAAFVRTAEDECKSRCSFTSCFQEVSFTDSRDYYKNLGEGVLRLIAMTPKRPALYIQSIPTTSFTDFLLYICNSFGIWFGLSFARFNFTLIWDQMLALGFSASVRFQTHRRSKCINSNVQTMLRLLLYFICFSGFVFQCFIFCNIYFHYKTSSRIEITAIDVHRLPNLVLCVRYREVADNKTWELYVKNNITEHTVRQLFQMTPEPKSMLSKCRYGFNQSEVFSYENPNECFKIWTVFKYVSGSDICYLYASAPEEAYSLREITSALTNAGIIYELYLNKSVGRIKHLYLISDTQPLGLNVTFQSVVPTRSRRYGESVYRDVHDSPQNFFVIQGLLYNMTLLPEPYDTQCLPDNIADFCRPKCNIQFMQERLGRVPPHEIIMQPFDSIVLSQKDLMNETVRKIITEGNQMCAEKCYHLPCDSYYSLTDASGYFKETVNEGDLVLAAGVPRANGLIIKMFPVMQLIDLLNNLAISASIWFGVSVLTVFMIPVRLSFCWVTKKNKIHQRVHAKHRMKRFHHQIRVTPRDFCRCSYCQRHF